MFSTLWINVITVQEAFSHATGMLPFNIFVKLTEIIAGHPGSGAVAVFGLIKVEKKFVFSFLSCRL